MRIVALMSVRNEELYLERCLRHLVSQGVDVCLIDNGSVDKTLEIASDYSGKGVFRIERLPYRGSFDFKEILLLKQSLAQEIDADWFIHHDADEIREAPSPYSSLKEAISDVDAQGFNAVDFNEFVFLPTRPEEDFTHTDYVREMKYYYWFQPRPLHRVNAWKKQVQNVDLLSTGGHEIRFTQRKVFPTPFTLRHYIALSQTHAMQKYAGRIHLVDNFRTYKFHGYRIVYKPDKNRFPTRNEMLSLQGSAAPVATNAQKTHMFLDKQPGRANHSGLDYLGPAAPNRNRPDRNKPGRRNPPAPFIVGSPRSGTTLLRLLLDAHPDLAIPPETHFMPSLMTIAQPDSISLTGFMHYLTSHPRWADFNLSKNQLSVALKNNALLTRKGWGGWLLQMLPRADNLRPRENNPEYFDLGEGLRTFYLAYAMRFEKKRWGDKTPANLLHMLPLQDLLPEAHFIHIIRDGRAVAQSMRKTFFGPGDDMKEQAIQWMWRMKEARQQAQLLDHYLEIRFEELVQHPVETLTKVCDFIDLPFRQDMLNFYKTAQARLSELGNLYDLDGRLQKERSARIQLHANTRRPIDPDRIHLWREKMPENDRKQFEGVAGYMLKELGYETGS